MVIAIKICVIGIVSVIFSLMIKKVSPQMATLLSLCTGILIFLIILPILSEIVVMFKSFATFVDYKTLYMDIVIKIICVCYISEIAAELCSDAGEGAIAKKIEMGAKVIIMVLSLPIINEILKTVTTIL